MLIRKTNLQAANIAGSCLPITRPMFSSSGAPEGSATVIYQVEINKQVPAEAAVQLGRTFGPDSLPLKGKPFLWGADGFEFINNAIYALDFTAFPLSGEEDFADTWRIEVVYRVPVWGQDEQPVKVGNIISVPEIPTQRLTEERWDFVTFSEEATFGRKVTSEANQTVETTAEIMRNTAGHPLPPVSLERRGLVHRFLFNTLDPDRAFDINEALESSTNDAQITIGDKVVKKHHARFLSAEQWDAGFYSEPITGIGRKYYRVEVQIELGKRPFYSRRPSEGPFFLIGADKNYRKTDNDGRAIPGPYPLDADGGFAVESSPQASANYLVLNEANYYYNATNNKGGVYIDPNPPEAD